MKNKTNLVICKGDESKSSEGLGYEDICNFAILHKELPKLFSTHVLSAAANKHFSASQGFIRTLLFTQNKKKVTFVSKDSISQ